MKSSEEKRGRIASDTEWIQGELRERRARKENTESVSIWKKEIAKEASEKKRIATYISKYGSRSGDFCIFELYGMKRTSDEHEIHYSVGTIVNNAGRNYR